MFREAFGSWKKCDADASEEENYRLWIKSKVWRAKCSLNSDTFLVNTVASSWVFRPLLCLWKHVEWLEERKNAILDLIHKDLSPLYKAASDMIHMLLDRGWAWGQMRYALCHRRVDHCLEDIENLANHQEQTCYALC